MKLSKVTDVCVHVWKYLGGHNEWWHCTKCGALKR